MNKSTIAKWKLRRIAPRALRALERNKGRSAAIAAYEQTLAEAVTGFAETYDQLRALQTQRTTELAEGRKVVEDLRRLMQGWASQVAMGDQVPGFDKSQYGDKRDVVDEVISDAEAFVLVVKSHADKLPQAATIEQEMTAAIAAAKAAWSAVEAKGWGYRELLSQNNAHAQKLQSALIAFRRTLVTVLGRGHQDFQMLRASKVSRDELEPGEEETLPAPEIPTETEDMKQAS